MKSKHLFQVFVLLAILFSALGVGQPAQAQSGAVQIVMRDLTYWNSIYNGYVDATRYEKWPLNFAETHEFIVTATPSSGSLSPLILLLDANNNELARAVGVLTSQQPMGSYYIQIQPNTSEGGTYSLTIREVVPPPVPTVSVTFDPATYDPPMFEVGDTTTAIVSLSNVPASGYPSVEFTCSYDPAFVSSDGISNGTDLFGADAVAALNEPAEGSFILAIAGSHGNKVVADGAAFTFSVTALQAGETTIACRARVSKGDNTLTEINHIPALLSIDDSQDGYVDGIVIATKLPIVSLYDSAGEIVNTDLADETGYFNIQAPAGIYKITAETEGFLKAEGTVTVKEDETVTMSTISLLAGDINSDGVIDQLDALTIGMNYNLPVPAAADLNNDANIDVLDLERLAANYRAVGPTPWQ